MSQATDPDSQKQKKKRKKPKPGDRIAMPTWLWLPLSILTVAAAFLLYRRGDPVAAGSVVVVALSAVMGFRMGFVRITATIVALVAAVALAPALGMNYEDAFAEQFGTTGLTNRFLCIASMGVFVSLTITLALAFISNLILAKRRRLRWGDHLAGFVIGMAEGVVLVWLVLGGLLSLQMWQRGDDIENNRVALAVDQVASQTRQSVIGPTIRDYNPFERIEALASVGHFRKTVQRFQDPRSFKRLMNNPKIAELRSDPLIMEAIDEIRNDPEIKQLIEQKQPVPGKLVMRLMSSPGLMQLVDHPEFLDRAREVIDEM